MFCAGSAPESIIAFLESNSFESAIRLAISLGGDADTMVCIAGAIAEPFYGGVPETIQQTTRTYLYDHLLDVTDAFCSKYVYEPRISN
ncbi:ADP-ribosylglycohydrolase family protein [bacterium]|nr:ADP-ribosylglycohydrolase family protein [bacterium]